MSENVRFSQNEPRSLGSALNSTPKICILLKFRPKSLSHAQNTTTKRCHVADMSYREWKTALLKQSTDNFAQNLNGKILIPAEDVRECFSKMYMMLYSFLKEEETSLIKVTPKLCFFKKVLLCQSSDSSEIYILCLKSGFLLEGQGAPSPK